MMKYKIDHIHEARIANAYLNDFSLFKSEKKDGSQSFLHTNGYEVIATSAEILYDKKRKKWLARITFTAEFARAIKEFYKLLFKTKKAIPKEEEMMVMGEDNDDNEQQ